MMDYTLERLLEATIKTQRLNERMADTLDEILESMIAPARITLGRREETDDERSGI